MVAARLPVRTTVNTIGSRPCSAPAASVVFTDTVVVSSSTIEPLALAGLPTV
jgi:hypothetical protein